MRLATAVLMLFTAVRFCQGQYTTGTLNIVLASPAGYVAATDSRGSDPTRPNCAVHVDDHQKLFRAGDSVITIAGFASSSTHTDYDLEVASIIRNHFSSDAVSTHGGLLAAFMPNWISGQLMPAIEAIDGLLENRLGDTLDSRFIATTVQWDTRRPLPVIRQIKLLPTGYVKRR